MQTIITDRRGRGQSLLDIAWLEHPLPSVGVVGPNTRIAVGLELHEDLEPIRLVFATTSLKLTDPARRPDQRLDVMAYFVTDDVSLREVARATHPGELIEEAGVQVQVVVRWAVEGSGSGGVEPARGGFSA